MFTPEIANSPMLRESLAHGVFRTSDDRFYASNATKRDGFCLQYLNAQGDHEFAKVYVADLAAAQAMLHMIVAAEKEPSRMYVQHFPQIPCEPFKVEVSSFEEAAKLFDTLAFYDLHQFEHNIKPDYCNMTILTVFDEEGDTMDLAEDEFEDYQEELKERNSL